MFFNTFEIASFSRVYTAVYIWYLYIFRMLISDPYTFQILKQSFELVQSDCKIPYKIPYKNVQTISRQQNSTSTLYE